MTYIPKKGQLYEEVFVNTDIKLIEAFEKYSIKSELTIQKKELFNRELTQLIQNMTDLLEIIYKDITLGSLPTTITIDKIEKALK